MRVALITDLPFWYSKTMYLNELEKRMVQNGIDVKVFVVEPRFFKKIDLHTGIVRFLNVALLLKTLSDFDLLHINFTHLAFTFLFFRSLRLFNKPIIIHTHGFDVFTVPEISYGFRLKMVGQVFTAYSWKRANRIIAVCKKAKSEIENAGIGSEKVDVIYNGIDENFFRKKLDELPNEMASIRENNDLIFVSVASILPVKNHARMLNAFEQLVKRYQTKRRIKLVLIGSREYPHLFRIENPNIVYLGKKNHSELNQFYSFADAFVLPSLSDANPWSMLEAMSCELPTIASDVGGIPEILDDSRFRFNPLDTQDILGKFELVTQMSPDERKIIGAANRQKILDEFTLDNHLKKLKEIYETLTSK